MLHCYRIPLLCLNRPFLETNEKIASAMGTLCRRVHKSHYNVSDDILSIHPQKGVRHTSNC